MYYALATGTLAWLGKIEPFGKRCCMPTSAFICAGTQGAADNVGRQGAHQSCLGLDFRMEALHTV